MPQYKIKFTEKQASDWIWPTTDVEHKAFVQPLQLGEKSGPFTLWLEANTGQYCLSLVGQSWPHCLVSLQGANGYKPALHLEGEGGWVWVNTRRLYHKNHLELMPIQIFTEYGL